MNKLLTALGMICLCLLFFQPDHSSIVRANAGQLHTYETTFSNADTSLSGVMTSNQVFFEIESYWNINDVKLNLDYQTTPLAKGEQSSVTLMINGTKFHSFRPAVSEQKKQRLTVSIPKALIQTGNNTVTIEGYIQTLLENEICVPVQKRDNWLQLSQTSGVAISYTKDALDGSIRDFAAQFIGIDTTNANQNAIAIPKQSDAAELEASVFALSGFAKANSLKHKSIPILAFDAGSVATKKAVVAVALYDHLPETIKQSLLQEDLSNKALIQLVNVQTQPTLVITSKNAELLVKAGRLIANQELVNQLTENIKIIDAKTNVDTPKVKVQRNVVLTESGDHIKGALHQERTYFVSLPANRYIADASKLSLDFRYAKNLDFDRSMVTVLVNNKPIGSKKLTAELANADSLTLPIPKNLEISGNFTVTVAFDLELKHGGCIEPNDQMPWAYMTKESMLQLNTKDRTELLFNNYPSPFLRDGSFNQVAVVLPQERDLYTYLTLSNLFNLLGQYAEGNTGSVKFYADTAAASELNQHNVIVIGTYENNKLIRDHNDKLYFQYDPEQAGATNKSPHGGIKGIGFKSNEKMSLDTDYGKRLGTLQLIDSPYEAGYGLMAVTGASPGYYYLASDLLASEETKWKVFGDGVATDNDGNIFAHRFKQQVEQEQTSVIQDVLQRSDVLGFIVAVALVLILVCVSLIFLVRKYRKNRGERDEA
ncbi:cellulose biosynthesis cyclic di-GMP-binding regulatory protein BcsB [Paenibacillus sp. 481]|uniref:cellulose biosynthesis cyclic di-GMP-binding regulatory protein BcsB n=1 Tax=Paenibacillus sp. 481 TaxID=2835869 RepID=UPI001E4AF428|nr:cellulose biosynthesis cyclic di-GMP-binding regulatory protein BcsB [Paenibacillus sp. 481]UHA73537.1 cellulose biosynthesis cyclic di-GMP-binding regulatory protein BcsB [Paenibacillus sp. 481]